MHEKILGSDVIQEEYVTLKSKFPALTDYEALKLIVLNRLNKTLEILVENESE